MSGLRAAQLPAGALLAAYRDRGAFTDCYAADLRRTVSLPDYITAFYNSWAFRPERWLLGAVLNRGADAQDVARLAQGRSESFAAWSVEGRGEDQLLLCDFQGKTRSWLMVEPINGGTRVYFGSAVVPATTKADAFAFRALLGFHRLYSRVLLGAAVSALRR